MSSKNKQEVKEATKNQEGKGNFAKDEMEVMSCGTTNTVTSNASTLQRTITVPSNAITIQSSASPTFQGSGTLVASDTAIAGRKDNLYHYAMCSIDLQKATDLANVLNENKKVSLNIDALQYEGTDVCVFLTQTQTLFTWEDGREIVFEVNAAKVNENVMFIVAPATPQSNGYITFTPADMTFSYALTSINISKPPTKTVYLEGESFDSSGMEVTATYSDGSTETVTDYTMSVSGFNSDNVTDSQTVTINVTLGNCTASYNLTISVDELKYLNAAYVRGSTTQVMDIHVPENLGNNVKVPAVITIHGGSWCGGDKGGYNYMTDFITNTCGCVHVNMNYRLTKDNQQPTGFTYMHMLEDIQSAIAYLQSHADIYHINTNKIALMGHSAGGHLALLYAYKAAKCAGCTYNDICPNVNLPEDVYCDKHKVSPAIPIELVISEAGPTNFVQWDAQGNLIVPDNNTCAMAGVMNDDTANVKAGKLEAASPINYIDANAPYTILAYGNGVGPFQGITTYTGNAGDGIIPYAHATAVYNELGSGKCSLFELTGVNHNQFGEGSGKVVYPNTSVGGDLEEIIDDYYRKIKEKLT